MTLQELSDALGVPPRQIRFMITEGCVPAAMATGRAADAYNEKHLMAGRRYIAMHKLGIKPAAIKVLMAFGEALPIFQGFGLELRIDPSVDPETIDPDEAIDALSQALREHLLKE